MCCVEYLDELVQSVHVVFIQLLLNFNTFAPATSMILLQLVTLCTFRLGNDRCISSGLALERGMQGFPPFSGEKTQMKCPRGGFLF